MGAASEFCLFPFSSCWYDDTHVIPALPHSNNMILTNRTNMNAVMPTYRRICKFVLFFHLIILSGIYKNNIFMYSTLLSLQTTECLAQDISMHSNYQRVIHGNRMQANIIFTTIIGNYFMIIIFATWLSILLLCSGDIHPNPGPSSMSSTSSTGSSSSNMSTTLHNHLSLNNNFSFVHYNVLVVVALLFYVHGKHLRSCRDGQLT